MSTYEIGHAYEGISTQNVEGEAVFLLTIHRKIKR
jgi:uncharacterized protein with von Willebrand factor type A (vWA) domain